MELFTLLNQKSGLMYFIAQGMLFGFNILPDLFLILLLSFFLFLVVRGAPYLPTDKRAVQEMIKLAAVKKGEKAADLGSGDGRIVIALAKAGAEVHGYEINPALVWWSRRKIKKEGLQGKAFVHWKSFWGKNFSGFTLVTLFGITGIMGRLEKKLRTELQQGSRIVSNIFVFPTWTYSKKEGTVYLYELK